MRAGPIIRALWTKEKNNNCHFQSFDHFYRRWSHTPYENVVHTWWSIRQVAVYPRVSPINLKEFFFFFFMINIDLVYRQKQGRKLDRSLCFFFSASHSRDFDSLLVLYNIFKRKKEKLTFYFILKIQTQVYIFFFLSSIIR